MKDESVKAKLNEYFARKSAVKSNLIIATVLAIVAVIFAISATGVISGSFITMLLIAFLWIIAICFFRHNVNGMQCALGAYLGSQILFFTMWFSYVGWAACLPATFSIIVFIAHQYLIAKRQSKDNALYINQLMGTLFMLGCVVNCVVCLVINGFELLALSRIVFDIAIAAAMNMIITIETRINEYKLQRDALTSAGKWSDAAKTQLKKEIFG